MRKQINLIRTKNKVKVAKLLFVENVTMALSFHVIIYVAFVKNYVIIEVKQYKKKLPFFAIFIIASIIVYYSSVKFNTHTILHYNNVSYRILCGIGIKIGIEQSNFYANTLIGMYHSKIIYIFISLLSMIAVTVCAKS